MPTINANPPFHVALVLQQIHLWLSAVWNAVGVWLVHQGGQALGPTASLSTAALLIGFAALVCVAHYYHRWMYILISAIIVLGALSTIANAFTLPTSNWPSEFWRFAGITLNSLGVAAGVWAITKALRRQPSD